MIGYLVTVIINDTKIHTLNKIRSVKVVFIAAHLIDS